METQEWIPFSLLASYKIVRTAGNSLIVLRSSWEVPYVFSPPFQPNLEFILRFLCNFPVSHYTKVRPVGAADGRTHLTKPVAAFRYLRKRA